jgi:hypothetical protein
MARRVNPASDRQRQPWVALGVSKRTWYRYVALFGREQVPTLFGPGGMLAGGMKYGRRAPPPPQSSNHDHP